MADASKASLASIMKPFIDISRPINVAITMATVFIAAVISGPLEPLLAVILASISAGFIAAAANTINDVYDIEIDRINKPERPLPAGTLSITTARRAAICEYVLGNLLAISISQPMFFVAFFFSLLTWLYAAHFKRTVLWGNLLVSLSTAAAFFYGGLSIGEPQQALIPALFGFLFHLGREIIKDIQDMEGDRRDGAITYPLAAGVASAIRLTRIIFAALIVATIIPYWQGWYGSAYFTIIVLGIFPVVGYVLFTLTEKASTNHLGFLSNLLKADMLVGLLALYLG